MSLSPAAEARIRGAFAKLADELVEVLAAAEPVTPEPERLLTIDQARRELGGLGRSTVFELIAEGKLRALKVGRRRLVASSAIAEFIAARDDGAGR